MKNGFNILRPRWRKVLADLWDNKLRTILVVASIAVGVFAVGTIGNSYAIISEDINISYASINPANIEIVTEPFDEGLVKSIEDVPGVKEALGQHMVGVRLSKDGEQWISHNIIAQEEPETALISRRIPVDGQPYPGRRNMVIEHNNFYINDYEIGDTLMVEMPDGKIRYMELVGSVRDQAGVGRDFAALPKVYVSMDTLRWLGEPYNFNRLLVTVEGDSDDEAHIEQVAVAVEDKLERSNRTTFRRIIGKTNEHPFGSTVAAMLAVMGALGVLVMILSGSLIANTLNALLSQHLRQIGVMKLVGARSSQIRSMYIVLILAFGTLALLVSVPLAVVGSYGLVNLLAEQINIILQPYRFTPWVLVVMVLGALSVPLIAGYFPVSRGSRTTVRRAISDDAVVGMPSSPGLLARVGERLRFISRPIMLSIRNTFRRKGRLALTLFTLIMAGAVFIAVFNVRSSMLTYLNQLGEHFAADVSLTMERPYRIPKMEQALYGIESVIDVEGWGGAGAQIVDENDQVVTDLSLVGPPADSRQINPEMVAGRWLQPGDERVVIVSDSIYKKYPNIQPGDSLRLSVNDGRAEDWELGGVFRFTDQIEGVFGYATFDTLAKINNTPDQAATYRIMTNDNSREEEEATARLIDARLREQGFLVSLVESGRATLEQAATGINVLIVFLLMMAILTSLVGSIGLMGTMGMNVLERTREIGVMRAIGAVDTAIMASVIIEGATIGFISWVLGGLLAFPFSVLLLELMAIAFSAPVEPVFTPQGYIMWLGVVLALSVIASVLPARNAARLTIREVLAYE
ncbi:MAG: ABC transporter permease [Candidatus Promineifilaceae bacterium]|nr:ABC transporter permease [Candidatus Promineifilaceae bacterium]